ncbi:MAG: DegT/DnrJ/EryC1/StrS family aminotransferase [Ruminococcaceae bacterium]|nr:DegT/DnrJ/EryC1/StrS family aminotransferase [Oscillospiraceae bacterium]
MKKLAIQGGEPVFTEVDRERVNEARRWPIITGEDEAAALEVIRTNNFSGTDITEKFEREFAAWNGTKHAVAYCNGTMALAAAMFGIGLGKGDEIICTTKTYWASVVPATMFGATAVFCNVDENISMDPKDLERLISPQTKAIVVVHYLGYPCDMDPIMAIARKHGLKVIEDVSHAQGGLYKGRKLGTFGDVAAMSLMSTKSFAAGEMGMVVTNDIKIYERVMAYGHYDRNNGKYIKSEELEPYFHVALGGVKGRVNQLCAAMGRVQLKYYDQRCAEIRKAMNYFYDQLDRLPGLKPLRVDESTGSNMAGFYAPIARYYPEELDGLPVKVFAKAVSEEMGWGGSCYDGVNYSLHRHNYFKTFDFNHCGGPSRLANAQRDVRELDGVLDDVEQKFCVSMPWIKKFDKELIDRYVQAFRNVIENRDQLMRQQAGGDGPDGTQAGRWYGFENQ